MKKLRKIAREYCLKQALVCWLVFYMVMGIPAQIAIAGTPQPSDGFVVGSGIIDTTGAMLTEVTVQSQESIINWDTINTIDDEQLNFFQDGVAGASVLNRVTGDGGCTEFFGDLNAETGMSIWMYNDAGILFGPTAEINVTNLVATSLNITNADFLNGGSSTFTGGEEAGDVVNKGYIGPGMGPGETWIDTERIALVGRNVTNSGIILANKSVAIAAGNEVLLSETGGKVSVEVTDLSGWTAKDYTTYQINNKNGSIKAVGSDVQIVMAAGDVWAAALIEADADADSPATAEIEMDIEGDLTVTDEINALADGSEIDDAKATITVNAGGDVRVLAGEDDSAGLYAVAQYGENNDASITVNAGNDVKVEAVKGGTAEIVAGTYYGYTNTAGVQIATAAGDVLVHAIDADAKILAESMHADDNTATVTIDVVGGDVKVIDVGEYGEETAKIEAYTWDAANSNTSEVTITATAAEETSLVIVEDEYREVTEIVGGNVEVRAEDGGDAMINAYAAQSGGPNTNIANVKITATAAEIVYTEEIETDGGTEVIEEVCKEGGNLEVSAEEGAYAGITATAESGVNNVADILICIEGDLAVEGQRGGVAEIRALAQNAETNTATVGLGVEGDRGVLVHARDGGEAFIEADAYYGYTNTAETVVCTAGDVIILDEGEVPKTAGILSEAMSGVHNDAYTGVCANGDVLVVAGATLGNIEDGKIPVYGSGGHAMIRAEAASYGGSTSLPSVSAAPSLNGIYEPSTANAETVVVSKEGGVAVIDTTGYGVGSAEIFAEAYGADENTANVGVSAGGTMFAGRGVFVLADGPSSKAEIHSYAHDGYQNTADTVVCTPEDVFVDAGPDEEWPIYMRPLAKIKSCAENGPINTATTRIYANDVVVNVPGLYRGNGIWAWADGVDTNPRVPADFWMAGYDGDYGTGEFVWNEEEDEGESFASVTVQDHSHATDCPVCPGCPCGGEIPAPVAPLAQFEIPRIEGCPALMLAAAAELGIPSETLQVAIGNSVAMNPSIQPCQACSTLVSAANMLKNEGDARLAAMAQAFNTLAPADAPYTPELAASVATAFATAEEGSQYASAAEYIDALVQYVGVLGDDLGSPVGDPVAYVMEKYGQGITGSDNANLTAFVTTRIEMAQTFAK